MAVDDRGGEVEQLAVVDARVLVQHLERARLFDRVAFHQDPLRTLDQRATSERPFEAVVFGEASQDDVDRALPVLDVRVTDVGRTRLAWMPL